MNITLDDIKKVIPSAISFQPTNPSIKERHYRIY